MTPRKTIFIIGCILILLPFPVLGFPQSWKNVFYILAGLGLACGAFISYLRAHAPKRPPERLSEKPQPTTDAHL